MSTATGSFTVYADRYDTTVRYLERFAKTLGVTVEIGRERVVGSTGFFRCRHISSSSLIVKGEYRAVKGFQEIAQVFCQDICRR